MRIAILDPFSGIAGDMTLGALLGLGLEPEWLQSLPERLGLSDIGVRIDKVQRAGIACFKVDFDIPPQPHGRHLSHIRKIVNAADIPPDVKEKCDRAFTAIATVEAEMHGVTVDRVHLHEVGAVDAILDVVGSIWGLSVLGVERVYSTTISMGDGFVKAAHGVLPVPAPATLALLEGLQVRPGPEGSGELVTPTGAALVRVLSEGPPPSRYTPVRTGYGAGTKEFPNRANALRITVADVPDTAGHLEQLIVLACDIDDMSGEYLAALADDLRTAGALDVVIIPTIMKKGRPGVRLEVLTGESSASDLERRLLTSSTSIGVRRHQVDRRALPREMTTVHVTGHAIRVKIVTLPDGTRRVKPEFEDIRAAADQTGQTAAEMVRLAIEGAEQSRNIPSTISRAEEGK